VMFGERMAEKGLGRWAKQEYVPAGI